MSLAPLALLGMVPLAIGPLPQDEQKALVARLCGGRTIELPVGGSEPEGCPFKACHAGGCRKKFDLAQ